MSSPRRLTARTLFHLRDRKTGDPLPADAGLRELMAVREIGHALLTAERPEEVFQLALDRVCPLVGASFGCVYLIDEGTDLMRLVAVHNWPQRYAQFLGQMRVRLGHGPSGQAASDRRVIEVLDILADPSLDDWREVATELGFRSFAALPLESARGVLGTVTFYFASPQELGDETRHLVRLVADQMAATADKVRLIEDLRRANSALTASNAALARQYADVVEARRVKDEFLANISHEMRTPLTAVIGYISLMQEGLAGPMTDGQQETLGQVKRSSEQLLSLIGDLLELTALKRGDFDAAVQDIDPRDPVRDALAEVGGKRDGVSLEIELPAEVPAMRNDRKTIAKVLRSLIDNAYKFTHDGEVRVSLEIVDDRVRYQVSDTGIGIPSDAHELVFEEFRQVDGTLTREYGGSGLGLALARRLARMVRGDITLASSPGDGSTFQLEVPLRYDSPVDLPNSSSRNVE